MFFTLLASFCIRVLSVGGLELPSYIPKCSLFDPNLNRCIIENGNAAIPRLVEGDSTFDIPSISPLSIPQALMEGEDLLMEWFNIYTDALNNYRLTDVSFTFGPNPTDGYYEGIINIAAMTGTNYNILSGHVVDIPANGSGHFMVTLVGLDIKVFVQTSTYEKDGEIYLNVTQTGTSTNVARGYYNFENISSPCVDDVNEYIEKNWREFTQQLEYTFGDHFSYYPNYILQTFTTQLPLNKIFLP